MIFMVLRSRLVWLLKNGVSSKIYIFRFNKIHDNVKWGLAGVVVMIHLNYFYVYGNNIYNNGASGGRAI